MIKNAFSLAATVVSLLFAPCLSFAQAVTAPTASPASPLSLGTPMPPPSTAVEARLPNGMEIVCRRDPTPLVAVDIFVKVGVAQENAQDGGISSFVARTLLASTLDSTPAMMQVELGDLGGNVSTSWEPDWTQISSLTVTDQFQSAVLLLSDVLKNADFDQTVVDSTRADMLSGLDTRDADLFQTDYQGIRSSLYPHSGYGLPSGGALDTVQKLTRADLMRFYDRYYVPQNMVVAVVGDIDPETAIQSIANAMDDFPPGRGDGRRVSDPVPPPMLFQTPAPVKITEPDLAETVVMIGYRVPPASSPEYPTFIVLNALLGGMKTSRLFTNLRENQGLAYELGSSLNAELLTGDLIGYVFAPPLQAASSKLEKIPTDSLLESQMLEQFQSFKTVPVTPAQLERAKHFLIGSYLIKHEKIEDRATYLGISVLTRGSADFDANYAKYINSVTAADVTAAANKYFNNPAVSMIVPDAAALKVDQANQQ